MGNFLFRFLPHFFFPLGLSLILCAAGGFAAWRGWRRAAVACSASAFLLLYACSTPVMAGLLLLGLESRHPQRAEYPPAEAIVVLGGSVLRAVPPRLHPEVNAYGDRILYGARLFKQGAAPLLVTTGGIIAFVRDYRDSEAAVGASLLRELWGIDSAAILLADSSMNTREDAVETARELEARGLAKRILLVTSAAHMPRALGVFKKLGFEAIPAPADFHAESGLSPGLFDLLPQEGALYETAYALHEYVGWVAYKIRGWL
jgi:uncharacterized SAM-binding protein YcdF (DUF218 family)